MASDVETAEQVKQQIKTKEDTKAETDVLFNHAQETRKKNRKKLKKLFVQAEGAETMAPGLQAESPPFDPTWGIKAPEMPKGLTATKVASVTKNVEAFFEKQASGLTEAQRRFPELLKVANATGPVPRPPLVQPKKATPTSAGGVTPVKSVLSGGGA